MPKKGIQYLKYSKIVDGKYTGACDISTVATLNGSPEKTEGEAWGDNRVVASAKLVKKIGLSLELNDLAAKEYADICGHTYDETSKKVTVKSTDVAPYIGIGAIGNSERDGKEVFILKLYKKAQFGDPNDENSTETNSIDYKNTTLEGTAYPDDSDELKIEQEFDTLAEAKTELDTLLSEDA